MSVVDFGPVPPARGPACSRCDEPIRGAAVVEVLPGPLLLVLHPGCAAEMALGWLCEAWATVQAD